MSAPASVNCEPSVAVLMYHRIADHVPDPLIQCVTPEIFWEQIQIVKRRYSVIGLSELLDGLRANRLPRGAVVLTFDDGYADNLWNAAPVLRDHNVPAAFFVVSGRIGKSQFLLHDRLTALVLESDLPHQLRITCGGESRTWHVNGCPPQITPWDVERTETPNARQQCFLDLHRLTRPLGQNARAAVIDQLMDAIPSDPRLTVARRTMNNDELRELASIDGFEIGCHTVNHPMLAMQPAEVQRREIFDSKAELERILNRPITAFAYPYGGSAAVSHETVNLVREAGFHLAFDAMAALVRPGLDRLLLPRFAVRNWPISDSSKLPNFSNRLKHWLDA